MGKRESYEPGTFSWLDLSTGDAGSAKDFYGELFGWEFEDNDIPGGGVYTMCHVQGDVVAAIMQQDEQPGHWNNYVTVVNADETTAKAKQLGAEVYEEPFDVMEAGRMAVFADPVGAMLCVWQPREHIGSARVNDVACLAWNELQTRHPETANDFYPELFGWIMEPIKQDGATAYVMIKNQSGWLNGGVMPMTKDRDEAASYWIPYFIVASCAEAVNSIEELGGKVLAGPMEPGGGIIAVANDPQGAVFGVFEGETDE